MPWEQVQIDADGNVIPDVRRVDVKVEDVHRTDLPGCPRHKTAGAIQQFTSWKDPDGTKHQRWTGSSFVPNAQRLSRTSIRVNSDARSH